MSEAENKMAVLQGNPTEIILFGEKKTVKRMSITKQQKAIKCIQNISSKSKGSDAVDFGIELMEEVLSIATDIPSNEIEENSSLDELVAAFEIIWEQNKFSFLLKTMASMGSNFLSQPGV